MADHYESFGGLAMREEVAGANHLSIVLALADRKSVPFRRVLELLRL